MHLQKDTRQFACIVVADWCWGSAYLAKNHTSDFATLTRLRVTPNVGNHRVCEFQAYIANLRSICDRASQSMPMNAMTHKRITVTSPKMKNMSAP